MAKFLIILAWIFLIAWGLGCLQGCYHTRKAITELSKRIDSVGFFKKDTFSRKDSSNTDFDLHGIDIYVMPDEKGNTSFIIPETGGNPSNIIRQLKKQFSKLPNSAVAIHIDSATVNHNNISTVSKGSTVDSNAKHTEEKQYTKDVNRKGTSIGGSIGLVIGIILVIIIIAFFIYKKFKL